MRNRRIFVLTALLVGVVVGFGLIYGTSASKVEVSPKGKNNKSGPIVLKAPGKLDVNSGSFTINPSVPGDLQIVDTYVIFWPEDGLGFNENLEYKANFSNYKMEDGAAIDDVGVSFSIDKYTEYSKLQFEVIQKFGHFEESANPFTEKLPYTEPYTFRVSYEINRTHSNEDKSIRELLGNEQNWREKKNNYTVIINTLVVQGNSQSYKSYMNDVKAARSQALKWISSQGVDVKNDISYVFVPSDRVLKKPSDNYTEIPIE